MATRETKLLDRAFCQEYEKRHRGHGIQRRYVKRKKFLHRRKVRAMRRQSREYDLIDGIEDLFETWRAQRIDEILGRA